MNIFGLDVESKFDVGLLHSVLCGYRRTRGWMHSGWLTEATWM